MHPPGAKSTNESISILYGQTGPRASRRGSSVDHAMLSPLRVGTDRGYFEDRDHWSGTDDWAVRKKALPEILLPSTPRTAERQYRINKLCETAWMPNSPASWLQECELLDDPDRPDRYKQIHVDGSLTSLSVEVAYLSAVEHCCGSGHWLSAGPDSALCYLAPPGPESQGSSESRHEHGEVIGIVCCQLQVSST